MKLSAILAPMIAANVPGDVILATVRAFEEQQADALEQRRASDRNRQAKKRTAHVMSRDVTVTASSCERVTRVEDKSLTTEIEPQDRKKETREDALSGFDEFWSVYPHKVGKAAAQKAFASARKRVALPAMFDAIRRYAGKSDDRPWCNPATWLNQDRWADEPAAPPMARAGPSRAPSQADVFALIGRRAADAATEPGPDDSRSLRPAIPHLSAVRERTG